MIATLLQSVLLNWAKKKWSLNRGGLLIEVKMHCKATIGQWSLNRGGLLIEVKMHCKATLGQYIRGP